MHRIRKSSTTSMTHHTKSRAVSYLGSWNEDVVTDDVLNQIAARAKEKKGKRLQMKINNEGVRLTRSRLLHETETKFFPANEVQALTKTPEHPLCLLLIVTGQGKKYKIVALKCDSATDSAHIVSVFGDVKKEVQSENVELKKRENGNWTLSGRTHHNANKHLLQHLVEHKQVNGEAVEAHHVTQEAGPVLVTTRVTEIRTDSGHYSETPLEYQKTDTMIFSKEIPTEAKINAHYEKPIVKTKVDKAKKRNDSESSHSSDSSDDFVIETEVTTQPYVPATTHIRHQPQEREITHTVEHLTIHDDSDSHVARVYNNPATHHHLTTTTTTTVQEPHRPELIRAASSIPDLPHQELYYSSSRAPDPVFTAAPAGYYTNPWAGSSRPSSRIGTVVPVRVDGGHTLPKYDQQSLLSNTSRQSKFSRSHKMSTSQMSIPGHVVRRIEHVYPRYYQRPQEFIILRRGSRPRPASYHPAMINPEMQVYYEDAPQRLPVYY